MLSLMYVQSLSQFGAKLGKWEGYYGDKNYLDMFFCLFFSSIKAVSLQLGRGAAKQLVQNRTEAFCASFLSLLSYKFVNYTVCKFRPLIMKIFKTECLLHSQLPNTHVCWSAAQEFARIRSHFKENLQQTHFQLFCRHLALFLSNKVL